MPLKIPRPLIMGILNATPDSFSDGGMHNNLRKAIQRIERMLEQGADIIDIGGESTRPGAKVISTREQIERVIPVIEAIRNEISKTITISIDTTNHHVALEALQSGANWINDVSAGEDSLELSSGKELMLELAAKKNAKIILMHRKGQSSNMQNSPSYDDVRTEVKKYLKNRASLALDIGVKPENIIIDPGLGFGKLLEHNLALLADLESLVALDYQVLLGTSRKQFIGDICNIDIPEKRIAGTCATTALAVSKGVKIFRVHDIKENRDAADIAWKIESSRVTLY